MANFLKVDLPYYKEYRYLRNEEYVFSNYSTLQNLDEKEELLLIFFANVIGECNSKIIHLYNKSKDKKYFNKIGEKQLFDHAQMAIYYCSLAAYLAHKYKFKELCFRNKGCAYERVAILNEKLSEKCELEYREVIINSFKEGYARTFGDNNVKKYRLKNTYNNILRYYDRIAAFLINNYLNISLNDDEFYINFIKDYLYFSNLAINELPRYKEFYIYRGKVYCLLLFLVDNKAFLLKCGIVFNETDVLNNIEYALSVLDLIATTLSEEEKKEYEKLKNAKNSYLMKIKT